MKQLFLTAVVTVTLAIGAFAAPIQSTCTPLATYGDVLALGPGGCQVEDKIFNNFGSVAGNVPIPLNWQVTINLLPSGEHNVDLAQGSTGSQLSFPGGPWAVQYDVKVDTTFPGSLNNFITEVGINLNAGATGRGLLTKTITNLDPLHGAMGALLGVVSTPGGSNVVTLVPPSQWIHVVETISLTRGTLSSFTDAYVQEHLGGVPEPATYAMMGLGLAALGLIARRKKSQR